MRILYDAPNINAYLVGYQRKGKSLLETKYKPSDFTKKVVKTIEASSARKFQNTEIPMIKDIFESMTHMTSLKNFTLKELNAWTYSPLDF